MDGRSITVGQVEAMVDPEDSAITKEEFAQLLALQIQAEIITAAMEDEWGIHFSADEIAEEADRIFEEINFAGESREDFLADRGITEDLLHAVAHQTLLEQAARGQLATTVARPDQEQIDAQLDQSRLALTEVCASHILVDTEDEALDVLSRLDDGEDFASLAQELSQDTESAEAEGVLPCTSPAAYAAEFADATMEASLNEVFEIPVETIFGFHVLVVNSRTEPDEDLLPSEDDIIAFLSSQSVDIELGVWLSTVMLAAEVTVEERFGAWMPTPPQVIPPEE